MKADASRKHHIVIVGGGFAGLYAFQTLQEEARAEDAIEITLIDESDVFTFIPMIHEVATGLLSPDSITMTLRRFVRRFVRAIVQGRVTSADLDAQTLEVSRADGGSDIISYDTLILATGSTTEYFAVPGAEEHALPLKTLEDARRIKNRIIESFDRADDIPSLPEVSSAIRFVIVGGGATGVEMAAELADCICGELGKLFPKIAVCGEVVVINRGDRLLAESDEWFSKKTTEALLSKPCTKILNNTTVEEVTAKGVKTDKDFIEAGMVIWCAGVKGGGVPIVASCSVERHERNARILTSPTLSLAKYPNVFVIGDCAGIQNPSTNQLYAMRAQFAVRQGKLAGQNILARLRGNAEQSFTWQEQGFILSLGQWKGIARIGTFRFSGIVAWVIYHVAYLRSLVGARSKLRTLFDWALDALTSRDFSKV